MSVIRWAAAHGSAVVGALLGSVLLALALIGWRAPRLMQLGLRNVGRRRLRTALIVCGLTLGSLVIGSALLTGDALTHTLRTLVTGSLGSVDEVVVRNPPRNRLRQQVQALLTPGFGGLAAAGLEFFDQGVLLQLSEMESGAVAAPAIVESVTVLRSASQQLPGSVALLAVDAELPAETWRVFGQPTALAGAPIALASLAADDVVLNAAAADALGAAAGDALTVLRGATPWPVRVAAISRNGGLAGTQPLLLVPLARYQTLIGQPGQVNLVLIANGGGVDSVARSDAAASDLRWSLANREVAAQLKTILAQPEVQRGLETLEARADGRERERLIALREGVLGPELTPELVSLMTDPRIRTRLQFAARRLPGVPGAPSASQLLGGVADLSVLAIKQETLDQATQYGAIITTVFLVLGIFSVIAALLLIGLIFALLAADRGAELATLRALGMRRSQIMRLFVWEGAAYNLAGAALGTLLSLLAGYGIVLALGGALAEFGIRLEPAIAPRSLVLAFGSGVLLALGAIVVSAWRVSRTAIVAATRGELVAESGRWQLGVGAALLASAALGWWRFRAEGSGVGQPLLEPSLASLALLGAALTILTLPGLRRSGAHTFGRGWLIVAVGGALVALWLRLLLALPALGLPSQQGGITLAVAGVALVVTLVFTAAQALGPLLGLVDRLLGAAPRWRAVVRPAAGYLSFGRGRTAMTMVLFGMVIFVMVTALTVVDVLVRAYGGGEPPVAGFDIRGNVADGSALGDIDAALAGAPAVSRATFRAVGSVATEDVAAIQLGLPAAQWQDLTLAAVNDGFVSGIQAALERRAAAYASDDAVWAALGREPGTAVVTGRVPAGITLPSAGDLPLAPLTLWIRPQSGGASVRLRVIGVVDARSELDSAVYVSAATAAGLGRPAPAPQSYFFAVADGVSVDAAAQGLQVSFAADGLATTMLGETARIVGAVRLLLVRLVQGFLGLGLLAGVSALGLLGVQAVLERRQQLGTLRAIGFTGAQVRATLVIESAAIALFGIGTGTAAGLIVACSLVAVLAGRSFELAFAVPWAQIALTVGGAWVGSALAIVLAAWQAGKVAPAEALRAA